MNKYSTAELKKYTIPNLKKLCNEYDMSTKTLGGDNKNKAQLVNSLTYKMNKTTKNMNGGDDTDMEYFKRSGLFQPFSDDPIELLKMMSNIDKENTITVDADIGLDHIPIIDLAQWREDDLESPNSTDKLHISTGSIGIVYKYAPKTVIKIIAENKIDIEGNIMLSSEYDISIPYLIPYKRKPDENNTLYMPHGIDLKKFMNQIEKTYSVKRLNEIRRDIVNIVHNSFQKLEEKGYYYTDLTMYNIICIRTGKDKVTIYLGDIGSCMPYFANDVNTGTRYFMYKTTYFNCEGRRSTCNYSDAHVKAYVKGTLIYTTYLVIFKQYIRVDMNIIFCIFIFAINNFDEVDKYFLFKSTHTNKERVTKFKEYKYALKSYGYNVDIDNQYTSDQTVINHVRRFMRGMSNTNGALSSH